MEEMKSSMADARIKMIRTEAELNNWINDLNESFGQDAVDYINELTECYNIDMEYPCIIIHDKEFSEYANCGIIFKSDFE